MILRACFLLVFSLCSMQEDPYFKVQQNHGNLIIYQKPSNYKNYTKEIFYDKGMVDRNIVLGSLKVPFKHPGRKTDIYCDLGLARSQNKQLLFPLAGKCIDNNIYVLAIPFYKTKKMPIKIYSYGYENSNINDQIKLEKTINYKGKPLVSLAWLNNTWLVGINSENKLTLLKTKKEPFYQLNKQASMITWTLPTAIQGRASIIGHPFSFTHCLVLNHLIDKTELFEINILKKHSKNICEFTEKKPTASATLSNEKLIENYHFTYNNKSLSIKRDNNLILPLNTMIPALKKLKALEKNGENVQDIRDNFITYCLYPHERPRNASTAAVFTD